jgi:hypothetical protein
MKNMVLGLGVLWVMISGIAYAQQLTVAVSPFVVWRGAVTRDDADAVYELFVGELAASGSVRVVDRSSVDKIVAELQLFKPSDWRNGNRVVTSPEPPQTRRCPILGLSVRGIQAISLPQCRSF